MAVGGEMEREEQSICAVDWKLPTYTTVSASPASSLHVLILLIYWKCPYNLLFYCCREQDMSIKLMKQRWLVKEVDDKKDSTEIVSNFNLFGVTGFYRSC
ncbi:unnamed protein product [Brugia timori]|uniref:Ovule protein n=1 Tax=Brugia timori TaxID=42155 RepID=A0A0R3R701_9BILA|nr:unnamed protein product [Brugia timori]